MLEKLTCHIYLWLTSTCIDLWSTNVLSFFH